MSKSYWTVSAAVIAISIAAPAPAFAQDRIYIFDIPAQDLGSSIRTFAKVTHSQVSFNGDSLKGKRGNALKGPYAAPDALREIVRGSGVEFQQAKPGLFVITSTVGNASTGATKAPSSGEGAAAIVVTGTRIRGGRTPSPIITIDSKQIHEEGLTDLGQVIRSVPQNFRGGQNPGVIGAFGSSSNQDMTGGSALNLRGLGPDATLTLLNGRRLPYDGFTQAVDISAIPVEAVQSIEIIPDGASAIYGSDAVGGVANVILKRDFDGLTVGARYGGATDGGLATGEFTATGGATWKGGGLIATVKSASVDPLYARQRSYTSYLAEPYTIYNGSHSRNALISAHQSIGDAIQIKVDALRTYRNLDKQVSVNDASYYRYDPKTSIALIAPSVIISIWRDWSLNGSAVFGKDNNIDKRHLASGTGSSLVTLDHYDNGSHSYEIGAEGPLFPLEGGLARLALGIGQRKDEFRYYSETSAVRYGGSERARYAYAELDLPFVSPSSNVAGVDRLELSAAIRGEDYASFGRVTTPKLGFIYAPTRDVAVKASWGRSFKAPTLIQRYLNKTAFLWNASAVGGGGYAPDATALMSYGGNLDLKPERARTWTASMDVHPQIVPGLNVELTWFNIDYTDRVVVPIISYAQALSNPAYSEFVTVSPTAAQIDELLSSYGSAFYNLSGGGYDPTKVVAILRDQYINVARQKIHGLDLSGSYAFNLGTGHVIVRGSASWLASKQQTSPTEPAFALAGTAFNPAKFNGRIGAVWTSRGLSASAFANHTSGVITDWTSPMGRTDSFTTVDATLSYNTGTRAGALSGLTLTLSGQNLLNRAPPLYAAEVSTFVPYDATNYSAVGRFLSASISKHF
jgi:iron complex outermembrane recepter protein